MTKFDTWQISSKATTLRSGDTQVDITDWGNLEGVNISVTSKDRANLLAGGLTWDELELLTAAASLHKAGNP
jgi:hypothetical protein